MDTFENIKDLGSWIEQQSQGKIKPQAYNSVLCIDGNSGEGDYVKVELCGGIAHVYDNDGRCWVGFPAAFAQHLVSSNGCLPSMWDSLPDSAMPGVDPENFGLEVVEDPEEERDYLYSADGKQPFPVLFTNTQISTLVEDTLSWLCLGSDYEIFVEIHLLEHLNHAGHYHVDEA